MLSLSVCLAGCSLHAPFFRKKKQPVAAGAEQPAKDTTATARPTKRGKATALASRPDSLKPDSAALALLPPDSAATDSALALLPPPDSVIAANSRQQLVDSLEKTSDLKSDVKYNAVDSIVYDVEKGMLYLYGKAEVAYEAEKISLKADRITMDLNTRTVHAAGFEDTLGTLRGTPVFVQDGQQYYAREMSYNFNSGKARIFGGRTQQGENYILSDTVKRFKDGTVFGMRGKFTTCNAEHPHFYIESSKMKMAGKQIISGPLRMVIGGFPLPVIIPFGFFPNRQGRQTGLILPKLRYAQQRGYALEGIGYYFAVNDHLDLSFSGDVYANGSFGVGLNSNYKWNYIADGNLNMKFTYNYLGEKGDPGIQPQRGFNISWRHNQPINPTTRLSGSVSLASSSYLRGYSLNANDYLTNQQRSSVSFSKTFPNSPFSLNTSLALSQDVTKKSISGTLPDFSFQMNRVQPLRMWQNKKWLGVLGNIGFSYNLRAQNTLSSVPDSMFTQALFRPRDSILFRTINTTDTTDVYKSGYELAQNGVIQNIPVNTQVKIGKYINLPLSANYTEYWYFKYIEKTYNPELEKDERLQTRTLSGFRTARDFNFNTSLSTNLYGIYQLTRTKRQVTIRQRMSPAIGYSFKPDFSDPRWGGASYYGVVQVDSTGKQELYPRLTTGIGGYPSKGENQGINMSLGNAFELKFRKKESFKPDFDEKQDKFTRLTLLNLTLGTSYNLAADSFQLAPFSLAANTSILNNKIGLFANGSINPYHLDSAGRAINVYTWQPLPDSILHTMPYSPLGRLTSLTMGLNTSFRPKTAPKNTKARGVDSLEAAYALAHPSQYVDFDVPWSVNFGFNFNYSKPTFDKPVIRAVTNINGDLSFTKNWKVTYSTGYDFIEKQATLTTLGVMRDLHCWTMAFNWTPFGTLTSYMISVNVKNATLQALRLRKQEQWNDSNRSF